MLKFSFFFILFTSSLLASITSDDNYKIYKNKNYEITYSNEYEKEAKFIKENINKLFNIDEDLYGYKLDEPIKLVLISNKLQIANAYSTQSPFNMAVFYNAGSAYHEYFSFLSWLKAIFIHELAHNYQINAKKSKLSKSLHKYLGNNFMPIWFGIPFFTYPNVLLPTFILEGNAVLNETLYNNGGRLYNGELNALKNSLVFSDKINLTSLINNNLNFPYTQTKYIVGGYFMQYLAYKYGIKKVNKFFYSNSIHSINPFLIDISFKNHFGISLNNSINNFTKFTKNKFKNYKELSSKNIIAKSKSEISFSKIDNKIYFITSDLKTTNILNIYDTNTNITDKKDTKLEGSKIFKIDEKLYISNSANISPTLYKFALFDKNKKALKSTIGKSIQDIKNNKIAFIDIKSSFLSPKLFINNKFYSEISSSALFDDKENIYYFKQENSKRYLYKNKTILYEFDTYFSKLVDIIDDEIYFIANTKNGSTLYKYSKNMIYKLSSYDNIIDAKIISKNKAIVSSINSSNYYVQIINLEQIKKDPIRQSNLKQIKNSNFSLDLNNTVLNSSNYNEFSQLQFSSIYPSYTFGENNIFTLNASFDDTLQFNNINLFLYNDSSNTLLSTTYTNTRNFIKYYLNFYNINKDYPSINSRKYGANFALFSDLLKKGNHLANIYLKQSFDDENKDKNPTSISLNHIYSAYYPLAYSNYFLSNTRLLAKEDRGDNIYGLKYKFQTHIYNEFYFNTSVDYLKSNANTSLNEQRGIKVLQDNINTLNDDTNILMQGYDNDFYTKDIQKYSFGLIKTINYSKYFAYFPISLRREQISIKYNYFKMYTYKDFTIKEKELNLELDTLWFHKLPIPINIKYITNDHSKDDYKIKISFGASF